MIVALDAGHGASRGHSFTGACANGLVEDNLALDFITRIGHHLRLAGHSTVYTRADKNLVPLGSRGKIAVASNCDLFLSIHCNAGPSSANGVEAFIALGDSRSRKIAEKLVDIITMKGMKSRGVKWDSQSQYSRLRVLRDTYRRMPAVLIEIGFLTNLNDVKMLRDKHWREETAKEIANVLILSMEQP